MKHVDLINVLLQEIGRRLQIACQNELGREQIVTALLPSLRQLFEKLKHTLGEGAALEVIAQATRERDLQSNLEQYQKLFERFFRPLFPPKIQ